MKFQLLLKQDLFKTILQVSMASRKIEIMDTTLRDGEQTSGVSFSVS